MKTSKELARLLDAIAHVCEGKAWDQRALDVAKKSLGRTMSPARLVLFTCVSLCLFGAGCRTFDYTDSDLERERQLMKQGGTYQPGNF